MIKTNATIGLLILVVLATGCQNQMLASEIRQNLIEANTELDSYTLQMSTSMDMKTETGIIKTEMKTEGKIDRSNRKLGMKGNIESEMMGMKMDMPYESYIVDDTIYTKSMDMWMKMDIYEDIWTEQDQIAQIVELVESGEIERQPDQEIGGVGFYVVTVNPDINKLVELALQGQEEALETVENLEESIKEYSSTLWINKDTWVVEKSKTDMLMKIETEEESIEMSTSLLVRIDDINQPIDIDLPDAASEAIDMSDDQNDRLPTSITGSTIAEVLD